MRRPDYSFALIYGGALFYSQEPLEDWFKIQLPDGCEPFELNIIYLDHLFYTIGPGKHRLIDEYFNYTGWHATFDACRFSKDEASALARLVQEGAAMAPTDRLPDLAECADALAAYLLDSSDPHIQNE